MENYSTKANLENKVGGKVDWKHCCTKEYRWEYCYCQSQTTDTRPNKFCYLNKKTQNLAKTNKHEIVSCRYSNKCIIKFCTFNDDVETPMQNARSNPNTITFHLCMINQWKPQYGSQSK